MIDDIKPSSILVIYQNILAKRDRNGAAQMLMLMADCCPYRTKQCLVDHFCPDCDFYTKNRCPWVETDLKQDKPITDDKQEV